MAQGWNTFSFIYVEFWRLSRRDKKELFIHFLGHLSQVEEETCTTLTAQVAVVKWLMVAQHEMLPII